jgi:hypothetical protein
MFTILEKDNTFKTIIHNPITLADQHKNGKSSTITEEFVRTTEDYVYRFPYLWHFWDEWADRIAKDHGSINRTKVCG